jgi:hypothetical protein
MKVKNNMKPPREKVKIDKGKKPKQRSKFDFENMKAGDSFYYEGHRSTVPLAYGGYLARGRYKTEPEGNGWRFYLKGRTKKE